MHPILFFFQLHFDESEEGKLSQWDDFGRGRGEAYIGDLLRDYNPDPDPV